MVIQNKIGLSEVIAPPSDPLSTANMVYDCTLPGLARFAVITIPKGWASTL